MHLCDDRLILEDPFCDGHTPNIARILNNRSCYRLKEQHLYPRIFRLEILAMRNEFLDDTTADYFGLLFILPANDLSVVLLRKQTVPKAYLIHSSLYLFAASIWYHMDKSAIFLRITNLSTIIYYLAGKDCRSASEPV